MSDSVRLCGTPPGSPVPGILQARILEWVAISFSNAGKWKVRVKSICRVWLLATRWTAAYQAPPSMGFSRQEYWSGLPLPSPLLEASITKYSSVGGQASSGQSWSQYTSITEIVCFRCKTATWRWPYYFVPMWNKQQYFPSCFLFFFFFFSRINLPDLRFLSPWIHLQT